jgi:hypothetical protein
LSIADCDWPPETPESFAAPAFSPTVEPSVNAPGSSADCQPSSANIRRRVSLKSAIWFRLLVSLVNYGIFPAKFDAMNTESNYVVCFSEKAIQSLHLEQIVV